MKKEKIKVFKNVQVISKYTPPEQPKSDVWEMDDAAVAGLFIRLKTKSHGPITHEQIEEAKKFCIKIK